MVVLVPLFLAVTRPFKPLSPARISSLTKKILQDAGADPDFLGAHSTRGGRGLGYCINWDCQRNNRLKLAVGPT